MCVYTYIYIYINTYIYVFIYVCMYIDGHPQPGTLKQARRGKALQALETFFFAGLDDPETTVRARQVIFGLVPA